MSSTLKILHLEDDLAFARMVEIVLEDAEFASDIKCVEQEEEFIEALTSFQPDVVVADYMLPGFDGMKALEYVRSQSSQLPFIFLSGYLESTLTEEAWKKGVTDIVWKDAHHRLPFAIKRAIQEYENRQAKNEAERKLKLKSKELEIIFNTVPAMIWFKDRDNVIMRANQAAAECVGRTVEQLEGQSAYDIFPEDAAKYHQDELDVINSGESKIGVRERYQRPGLPEIWVRSDKVPFKDEQGSVLGVIIFSIDITQRKEIEDNLLLRNEELNNFAYRVSHDLRAPLTTIMGLTNLLREENNPDSQELYISLIEKGVKKLDRFIKDVLAYSTNQNVGTTFERIDFHKVIEQSAAELEYLDGFDLVKRLVSVTETPIFSDFWRLKELVKCLLSNGIVFRDLEREFCYIRIEVSVENYHIKIVVEDNGLGISPKIKSRIFDMFYRGHARSMGSGIGLYIAKQTVEKLGGSIKVKSVEGKGTKFTVTLPNMYTETGLPIN